MAVTDPFVWQHDGMVSAWLFFGFSGHLDYNAAAMAAHRAYDEATSRHPPDSLIGAGTRTWTGVYRDAEPVDFVLIAHPIMTWRMLAEGITGAQMVVYEGKEFRFSVSLDGAGLVAGYGWMMRRGSTPGNIAGSMNDTESNVPWPTDLAATLTAVAEVKVNASRVNV